MADLQTTGFIDPWAATQPGLQQFYQNLFPQFQASMAGATPPTPGEQVAPLNPMQQAGIGQLGAYGQPGGAGFDYQQFAGGQLGQGLDMSQVQQYADNPWMDQMITASLRDPYRNLTENQLPMIDLGAAFSGNMDSSRSGLAEGVAQRGYGDRATDIAAQMRGGAYSQGLQVAGQTRAQDQNFAQLAQSLGLSNIDALMAGGGMMQDQQQSLANAGMGNFMWGQNAPWQFAENYANLAAPAARGFGTQYGEDRTQDWPDFLESLAESGLFNVGIDILGGI